MKEVRTNQELWILIDDIRTLLKISKRLQKYYGQPDLTERQKKIVNKLKEKAKSICEWWRMYHYIAERNGRIYISIDEIDSANYSKGVCV